MAETTTIQGLGGKEIKVYGSNYDNSEMEQDDFLKVLIATFKYQDPFEAEDISNFISNNVKLRELEVMNNFENAIKDLQSFNNSLLSASNLIGKKILYEGKKTYLENGKGYGEFVLDSNAGMVEVYIRDKNGNIVDKSVFTDLKEGEKYPIEIENSKLEDGYYILDVVAKNKDESVGVTTYSFAKVESISKDGNSIIAGFEDDSVNIEDIVKIGG